MITFLHGDCRETLKTIEAERFQMCASSPPYFGLRNYQKTGQIGLEKTPTEYIAELVGVFREVRRVLKPDGVLWLNLGDSYAGDGGSATKGAGTARLANGRGQSPEIHRKKHAIPPDGNRCFEGLLPKNLVGIPWRTAFALQADGWFLRSAIPWVKRNCMPEPAKDRPTSAVEYVFLFSKAASYFYDAEAVAVEARYQPGETKEVERERGYYAGKHKDATEPGVTGRADGTFKAIREKRNLRNSDWFFASWQGLYSEDDPLAFVVNPKGIKEAHFAAWPEKLVEPMILAGSRPGDEVLDVFGGSGTTGRVAVENGRRATLCELNEDYIEIARQRTSTTAGLGI